MNRKRKAKLCDDVILKFSGDKSFFWHDLHGRGYLFNDLVLDSDTTDTSPNGKYFVIQPILNLLLEDGVLKRMDNNSITPYLSLTDKGNAIYPDIKHRGYVTKHRKERNKGAWIIISGIIIVLTFLILIYDTWFHNKNSNPKTEKVQPANISHETPLDTNKLPEKRELPAGADTPSTQNLQPTKQVKGGSKKTQ